jgi:hypothetical protein
MDMFLNEMLRDDGRYEWSYDFTAINDTGCYDRRERTAKDVLDYLSRLSELYMFQEVR